MQNKFHLVVGIDNYTAFTFLDMIKDSARPTYWVPDDKIKKCKVCNFEFRNYDMTFVRRIHHCRDCGEGVCSSCSTNRCSVPHRGWEDPVRVCDKCIKKL